MPRSQFCWILLAIVGFTNRCHAQTTAPVGSRTGFTEPPGPVLAGRVTTLTGLRLTSGGGTRQVGVGEVQILIPQRQGSELQIGLNSYGWTRGDGGDRSGFEDASIGVKQLIARRSRTVGFGRPDIGWVASTTLSTGGHAYGAAKAQPSMKLAAAWDLSRNVALISNLGYTHTCVNDEQFGQLFGSLWLGHQLSKRSGLFVEGYGFLPFRSVVSDSQYVNLGVTYRINNDNCLDFQVGKGIGGDTSTTVRVGLARRW